MFPLEESPSFCGDCVLMSSKRPTRHLCSPTTLVATDTTCTTHTKTTVDLSKVESVETIVGIEGMHQEGEIVEIVTNTSQSSSAGITAETADLLNAILVPDLHHASSNNTQTIVTIPEIKAEVAIIRYFALFL